MTGKYIFTQSDSKPEMLHGNDLAPRLAGMTASERTRKRLQEERLARGISQRDLADLLTKQNANLCTQGKISKVLAGHVELKLDDADAIAQALGISLTEAVRDSGLEFCAEMTPSELRVLQLLRQRPGLLEAVMVLLRITPAVTPKPLVVLPPRPKRGRPLNSAKAR